MAKTATGEGGGTPFPVKYTILQVEPWTLLDARGNPVAGYKVTFTFEAGITDTVDVPKAQYNAAAVSAMIEAAIVKHAEVLSLGG